MAKALNGIRVLDFSHFLAGPFCAMLLASMGAEVIRVEPPGGGLDREVGPYAPTGESMIAWHFGCEKKGITLNTQSEKGREILADLVRIGDVVIESFVPQTKKASGLDYESLKAINPRIILTSVSAYGQSGPYSHRGGFDAIAQGMSGMMSISGFPDGLPLKSGSPTVDYGTAIYAALGTVVALFQRQFTGVGQTVDVSLLDTAVSFMETVFAEYNTLGSERRPLGNQRPFTAPSNMVKVKDGYINIGVGTDSIWRRFTRLTGNEQYRDDPRYSSSRVRYKNRDFLSELASKWAADKTGREAIQQLEAAGIPAGYVYSIPEVLADPHIKARNMIVEIEYPGVGKVMIPGIPIKLSETDTGLKNRAPMVGEHNESVYCQLLGYTKEKLAALHQEGVI